MSTEIASKEDFKKLEDKVDDLLQEIRILNTKLHSPKVVTVKDICMVEGISKSKASIDKFYLPRFGQSAYEGAAKWDISEYLEWRKRPLEERRREYQEMTFQKNQRKIK